MISLKRIIWLIVRQDLRHRVLLLSPSLLYQWDHECPVTAACGLTGLRPEKRMILNALDGSLIEAPQDTLGR